MQETVQLVIWSNMGTHVSPSNIYVSGVMMEENDKQCDSLLLKDVVEDSTNKVIIRRAWWQGALEARASHPDTA